MWITVKFKRDGEVEIIEKNLSLERVNELKSKLLSDSDSIILWDSEYPTDKSQLKELMNTIFSLNKGKDLKIFPNTKMDIDLNPLRCGCPSRCFCQWEGNSCSCWTTYCRPNGCIWKRCPGSC